MALTKKLLNRLDDALALVSGVLSDVPDADWNDVLFIQGAVNDVREKVSSLLDAIATTEREREAD